MVREGKGGEGSRRFWGGKGGRLGLLGRWVERSTSQWMGKIVKINGNLLQSKASTGVIGGINPLEVAKASFRRYIWVSA